MIEVPEKYALKVSTVTAKGQLTIPAKLRRKYAIRKGTQVAFVEEKNRLVLQPLTPEFIRSLRGFLKGEPSASKVLYQERRRESPALLRNPL